MSDFELVATLDDLPEGEPLGVETTRGERICLVNAGGEVLAVSNVCTHQEFAMDLGTVLPGGVIECAWHGARFDLRTGTVLLGPATEPLPCFEVRVEKENVLVGRRKS
jgi:3-phenylpropionate/trans-cinnamate dioxygenase ferredoxin component